MSKQQLLGVRIDIAGSHGRMQKGGADFYAASLRLDVQKTGRANDRPTVEVTDCIGQPMSCRDMSGYTRPPSLKISSLAADGEQFPPFRVAVARFPDLLLPVLMVRLDRKSGG